jgi:ATP-dependent 26S proteasome regulatory subunit
MAAGFCFRSLLLHGPAGAGKTELVHALAAEMGCCLLYVPGGESLLKTYQQEGHRLLRALFTVCSGWVGYIHHVAPVAISSNSSC